MNESKMRNFFKNPLNTSNLLTAVLIFVTLISVWSTINITKVSLDLEKQRHKELLKRYRQSSYRGGKFMAIRIAKRAGTVFTYSRISKNQLQRS